MLPIRDSKGLDYWIRLLHGGNPGLVGFVPFEEGSPNACARSSLPFSVAGPEKSF